METKLHFVGKRHDIKFVASLLDLAETVQPVW